MLPTESNSQSVSDTSPLWSGTELSTIKAFLSKHLSKQLWGYTVSLCRGCYELSASAASLMLEGLKAGLNRNHALPILSSCAEMERIRERDRQRERTNM